MDAEQFTTRLRGLSGRDIEAVARMLRDDLDSADGELAWWKATLVTSGTLRRGRLTRRAGLAAHLASEAVLQAASRAGEAAVDRTAITMVARAASEAARALVAGTEAEPVLAPWLRVLAVAA